MNATLAFMKISLIAKNLFDRKTGEELANIKSHFSAAFSDGQLCALVVVGMICRVFGLTPPQKKGSRSMWTVVSLFVQFLQTLRDQPDTLSRAIPTPLDIMVEDGLDDMRSINFEADQWPQPKIDA